MELGMEAFKEVKLIGRGNYGSAILVERIGTGDRFVIKKIAIMDMSPAERDQAKQEVVLLANLKHPCIVRYEGSFIQNGYLHIIMQYCENGDLGAQIRRAKKDKVVFSEAQILDWFAQLALAVQYIHRRRILHRDLKSSNVFLAKNNLVRLGDFGIARVLEHTFDQAKTVVGTPYYMSPEVCENRGYDERSDIWALGCVLYEMCSLEHAFQSNNLLGLVYKIVQERQPALPAAYSPELRGLVDRLLSKDPALRPDAAEILRMPFIAERLERLALLEGSTAGRSKPLMRMPSAGPAAIQSAAAAAAASVEAERRGGGGGATRAGAGGGPPAPSAPPTSAPSHESARGAAAARAGAAGVALDDGTLEPAASLVSPAPTPVQRQAHVQLAGGGGGGAGGSPLMAGYAFPAGGGGPGSGDSDGPAQTPSRLHLPAAAAAASTRRSSGGPVLSPVSAVAADLGRQAQLLQARRNSDKMMPLGIAGGGVYFGGKAADPDDESPQHHRAGPLSRLSDAGGGGASPHGLLSRRGSNRSTATEQVLAAARAAVASGASSPGPSPTGIALTPPHLAAPDLPLSPHGAHPGYLAMTPSSQRGGAAYSHQQQQQTLRRSSVDSDDGSGSAERRGSIVSTGSAAAGATSRSAMSRPLLPLQTPSGGVSGRALRSPLPQLPSVRTPTGSLLARQGSFGGFHADAAAPAASTAGRSAEAPTTPIEEENDAAFHSGVTPPSPVPQLPRRSAVAAPPMQLQSPSASALKPSVELPSSTRTRSVSGASAPGGLPSAGSGSLLGLTPLAPLRGMTPPSKAAMLAAGGGMDHHHPAPSYRAGSAGSAASGGGGGVGDALSPRAGGGGHVVVRRVSRNNGAVLLQPPSSAGSNRTGSAGSAVNAGGLFGYHSSGRDLAAAGPALVALDAEHHHHGLNSLHHAVSLGSAVQTATPGRPWTVASGSAGGGGGGHSVRLGRALSAVTEGSVAAEVPDDEEDAAASLAAAPPALARASGGGAAGRAGGAASAAAVLRTSPGDGGGAGGKAAARSHQGPGPVSSRGGVTPAANSDRRPGARGGGGGGATTPAAAAAARKQPQQQTQPQSATSAPQAAPETEGHRRHSHGQQMQQRRGGGGEGKASERGGEERKHATPTDFYADDQFDDLVDESDAEGVAAAARSSAPPAASTARGRPELGRSVATATPAAAAASTVATAATAAGSTTSPADEDVAWDFEEDDDEEGGSSGAWDAASGVPPLHVAPASERDREDLSTLSAIAHVYVTETTGARPMSAALRSARRDEAAAAVGGGRGGGNGRQQLSLPPSQYQPPSARAPLSGKAGSGGTPATARSGGSSSGIPMPAASAAGGAYASARRGGGGGAAAATAAPLLDMTSQASYEAIRTAYIDTGAAATAATGAAGGGSGGSASSRPAVPATSSGVSAGGGGAKPHFTPHNAFAARTRCRQLMGPAFERVYGYLSAVRAPDAPPTTDEERSSALRALVGGDKRLYDACGQVDALVFMEQSAKVAGGGAAAGGVRA